MNGRLKKKDLVSRLQSAVSESADLTIEGGSNPFTMHALDVDGRRRTFKIYIWNLTHGGKTRLENEFRIQRTGKVLRKFPRVPTLVLGWHEGFGVFAAFDIRRHLHKSSSPSLQVKEEALLQAHVHSFAAYKRGNGEIAIAFRPDFLLDYAFVSETIHDIAQPGALNALDKIDRISDREIAKIPNKSRREIVRTLKQKYREHDFRARVLSAYKNTCAICGIQLGLVEAAHIVPVQRDGSTDETTNGVALCSLHHRAYDRGLISFDPTYRVQTSDYWTAYLKTKNIHGGLGRFRKALRPALNLPADKRDYPNPEYVRLARIAKRWR